MFYSVLNWNLLLFCKDIKDFFPLKVIIQTLMIIITPYMTVIFIIAYTIKLNLLIFLFAVLQTACLWAMRCLAIQRQLSDENNEITKNKIFTLVEKGLFFTGFHIFWTWGSMCMNQNVNWLFIMIDWLINHLKKIPKYTHGYF